MLTWHDTNNYQLAYAETDDPRVIALIQRDEYNTISELYDGDAINPIIYVEHRYGLRFTHQAGYDGGEAELMQRAYDQWGWDATARRWLWIFHGIAAEDASGGYDRDGNWIVATSSVFLDHVGVSPLPATYEDARKDCEAVAHELSQALDGDVYGIGYAINEARVTTETPVEDCFDEFEQTIECWGYVGDDYAKREALASIPTLNPLLPLAPENA